MSSTLFNVLEKETNYTKTLNGAETYKSSLSGVVDFFALGGAVRNHSVSEVIDMFAKAWAEDELLTMKTLFYLRDIRGGQGERKTFRRCVRYLAEYYPRELRVNLELFGEYGRWDDLLGLHGSKVWPDVLMLIDFQLKKDLSTLAESPEKPISLLGKWLPSINASSSNTKAVARAICRGLNYSYKDYRKTLSRLRKEVKIVERHMCSKEWNNINYETVPSQAMHRYSTAFAKHSPTQFEKYINDVNVGERKINASALYPYQIVDQILGCQGGYGWDEDCPERESSNSNSDVLNAQWNALPDFLEGNPHNGIVVVDTSGSMYCNTDGGSVRPISIALSLGIYFAERNTSPAFGNSFITFSSEPEIQRIQGTDIRAKVNSLKKASWNMSTDLQAVFDIILSTALEKDLPNKDLPEVIYIVSDMEFDQATYDCNVNFRSLQEKYEAANYSMPKIVFWNVDAKTTQVPVTMDESGTALVSGASPAILTTLLSGEISSPKQVMLDTITSDRYDLVTI